MREATKQCCAGSAASSWSTAARSRAVTVRTDFGAGVAVLFLLLSAGGGGPWGAPTRAGSGGALDSGAGVGGEQMRPHIAELAQKADVYVSCYPNAGLPNPLSPTGFPEGPEDTAAILETFARDGLVNIVGGCCGTTPEHIGAIGQAVGPLAPRKVHNGFFYREAA